MNNTNTTRSFQHPTSNIQHQNTRKTKEGRIEKREEMEKGEEEIKEVDIIFPTPDHLLRIKYNNNKYKPRNWS